MGSFKQHLLLFVIAFGLAGSVRGKPKDGCLRRCGNVTIPFPFGTEEGCYLNDDFLIGCDDSGEPFLNKSRSILLSISLLGELRLQMGWSQFCSRKPGEAGIIYSIWDFSRFSTFPLSTKRNKLTAVGCDTYAFLQGLTGTRYKTGCISLCDSIEDAISAEGSCSGVGCCQTSIPGRVKGFNVTASSFYNHRFVRDFNNCSYVFLVEDGHFNFSASALKDRLGDSPLFPVVFDWSVGNRTCKQVGNFSLCSKNSKCIDSRIGSGYNCNCRKGYDGNPYLPNGCQDIDECARRMHNCAKTEFCHNIEGSFVCRCPKGHQGDARKGCFRKRHAWLTILLGASIGVGVLSLGIGTWLLYKFLRKQREINRKKKFFKRNGGLLLEQQIKATQDDINKTRIFRSKELEKATDKFNQNRVLGHGSQGTVYKGMLADGRIVAVKRSKAVDEDNLEGFINEVVILSQISHRNIVKLLGCCLETEVPILVYEFVPNRNLFEHLHQQSDDFMMTWEVRLRISIEAAGAVSYLHSAASIPIYHRDIKSTNILLDEKYQAKVSDFGTSRSVPIDHTHLTTLVSGTMGYIDPEYFQSSRFTDKSDVYSFGVVLVELITGEKPISLLRSPECRGLATRFILSMKENKLFDIIDARVKDDMKPKEVIAMANLAKRRLNLNSRKRPTMREVSIELERIRSSSKDSSVQIQNDDEEDEGIEINIDDSWNIVHTAPAFDIAASSSLDVEPLVPRRTW